MRTLKGVSEPRPKWTQPHTLEQAKEFGRFERLVAHLVSLGCGRKRAEQAITTTLLRDDVPANTHDLLLAWAQYALSPHAASINAKGYFVAARVEQGQKPPDFEALLDEVKHASWLRAAGGRYVPAS
ncbi:MAG TPA: hypothetical protein VIK33_11900 [Anaerolineae bacterium]